MRTWKSARPLLEEQGLSPQTMVEDTDLVFKLLGEVENTVSISPVWIKGKAVDGKEVSGPKTATAAK